MVESAKGHVFSHPAIGYHFIDASKVIGDIHTFSITEGFSNRAEVGYTRSVHKLGDSTDPTAGAFSDLWHFNGMNVFHGKVVAIKDGQFGPWTPRDLRWAAWCGRTTNSSRARRCGMRKRLRK